jgi:hypothetical protein
MWRDRTMSLSAASICVELQTKVNAKPRRLAVIHSQGR